MASSPFSMDGYDASPISTPLFGVPMGGAPSSAPAPTATAPDDTSAKVLAPHHHGFFKDALGFLGDFLLSRLHLGTPYRDAKKNEELQNASANYAQDPQGAFRRMASVDFGAATKFADQQTDNARLQAQQSSTQEARESRIALLQQARTDKNRSIAAQFINSLAGSKSEDRAATYTRLRGQALTAYGQNDPELANFLPETYDPAAVDAFTSQYVPVGQQRSLAETQARDATNRDQGAARIAQGDRRLGQGDRAADQRDRTIGDTETRDRNTNARGNRALDLRAQGQADTKTYREAVIADRQRRTATAEAAPKSGSIVILPDGRKAKIK